MLSATLFELESNHIEYSELLQGSVCWRRSSVWRSCNPVSQLKPKLCIREQPKQSPVFRSFSHLEHEYVITFQLIPWFLSHRNGGQMWWGMPGCSANMKDGVVQNQNLGSVFLGLVMLTQSQITHSLPPHPSSTKYRKCFTAAISNVTWCWQCCSCCYISDSQHMECSIKINVSRIWE